MSSPKKSDKNDKYHSVFLSHSSKDAEFVNKLAERFKQAQVKFWLNKLKIGDSLFKEIGSAINDADFFAIVLSKNSIGSNWVKRELRNALSKEIDEDKVVVLPILIEDVPLPPFLNDKVYADFTTADKFEESFQELLDTLLKEIDEEPSSEKFYPNKFIPELKFFVGRTQLLEDLKNQLNLTHRASIHDISGIGKTFSSYKFADANQNDYDKIFFVRANKEEMLQSLAQMGVLLNPSLEKEPDQSKQAMGFKDWLEKNNGWLVIYDNVDVPAELNPYVPLSKSGDCIFTSNFQAVKRLGEEISIEKLDKDEAKALLFSRANSAPHSLIKFDDEKEQKAFENIVREIDGHPLSLNTTGAFISFLDPISFAEFERKLKRKPEVVFDQKDKFDTYHNETALKAFSIAIDDISEPKDGDEFENSPELAQKVLFASAFVAPENIPEDLLQKTLQNIAGIDFDSEENEDLWLEIRRKLGSYDLLKFNKTTRSYFTHRLVQKILRSKQNDDEKKAICEKVVALFLDLFPKYDYFNKEICEKYYQHVQTFLENTNKLQIETVDINSLYYLTGRYQKLLGNYGQAEIFHRRAAGISAKLLGSESSSYATDLNNLALVYSMQDRYDDAIEKYVEVIEIYKKTLGNEHEWVATALNNLGGVYQKQGRYEEAIEKFTEASRIDENTIGKEHPGYALRLNNLAVVYRDQGRYEEAIEKIEEALRIDKKTIGKEHPDYAIDLTNLAHVYQLQGRYEEAIEKYEEALRINEKTIGKEHPNYALHLNNLAHVYQLQGRYEETLPMFEEAMQIFAKALGEDHPNTQAVKENLEACREKMKGK